MEVHPGMSFYNNVHDGTALVTKTLESTHHLTPLHIPPGPPISPERYEELRENFQLCKPVLKAGQESGGREPMLPESHRNYEPPYKFHHEHHYYGNTRDAPLRFPGMSENTDRYMNYGKYKSPGTLLVEGRYRPFHPYVHCNTDIRGSSPKNEAAGEPFDINRQTRGWPGERGAFHVSQFAEGNDWAYNPEVPVAWAPKSTFKPPELDISSRAANMLENVKQALWLSTYKRDFSGRGPMNPLLLDDYDAKVIGRATGELGKYVELRESFPSGTSQARPLEGRIARALQGRQRLNLVPQQQDSPDVHRPPLRSYRENSVVLRDSEGARNCGNTSLSSFQHDPNTTSGLWRRNMYLLPNHIMLHLEYPKESTEDKKLPWNRFQKITDTWKTENLYQRQLAIPPEPEPTVKPADSIYYEDLEPSRLNRYIVWHHPVSLSKPGPSDLCFEKPVEIPDPSLTSHPKAIPTLPSFPKWIPNHGVAQPQTKLLDIQDSFSKSDAIKRLNDLRSGGLRDLRDHDREGKRHTFQGVHAHFFH